VLPNCGIPTEIDGWLSSSRYERDKLPPVTIVRFVVQPAEFGGDGFALFWKNGAMVIGFALDTSEPPLVKSGGGDGQGTVPMCGSGPTPL
jgi:hypothetical protein